MVGHVDGRDLAAGMTHNDKRLVTCGKQLVLRKRAAQTVDRIGFRPGKLPAEDAHAAALIAGADKAGVVNIALVGG